MTIERAVVILAAYVGAYVATAPGAATVEVCLGARVVCDQLCRAEAIAALALCVDAHQVGSREFVWCVRDALDDRACEDCCAAWLRACAHGVREPDC